VVFTQRGTLGQVAIVPQEPYQEYIVSQSQMKLTVDPGKADPLFIYYAFTTDAIQNHLRTNAIQTGVPHINLGILRQTILTLPPLHEQQAIAEVLGALDDKIELNRRMNATLEELARTIFRSWFVDFDPVHAKAEGRAPFGMDAATAALFPDTFVPSELGDIPAGWKTHEVKFLANLSRQSVQPQSLPSIEFDLYSLPAFDAGQTPSRTLGSTIKSGKFSVPRGAVLLSKLNPSIPRVWAPEIGDTVQAIASTEFLVFVPIHMSDRPFVYYLFQSSSFRDRMISQASGTSNSHQRVRPDDVLRANVVHPGQRVMDSFSNLVEPMMAKGAANLRESQTLAELRDTLLPKLLSGEITVRQAEREVVGAT
jgi:type I restriction enzyme S subunit